MWPVRGGTRLHFAARAALLAALFQSTAVFAQVGSALSARSEERFRGRPVSAGNPVFGLDLTYDIRGGAYVGGSATAVVRAGPDVRLLGSEAYVGYATRLRSGATLDIGITNRFYSRAFSGGFDVSFFEVHAGLTTDRIAYRLYASPSYYGTGRVTLYGAVDAIERLSEHWSLQGHIGLLVPLNTVVNPKFVRHQYDWRVGVSRRLGPADLTAAWTSAGPRPDNFGGRDRGRGALVIGLSYGL